MDGGAPDARISVYGITDNNNNYIMRSICIGDLPCSWFEEQPTDVRNSLLSACISFKKVHAVYLRAMRLTQAVGGNSGLPALTAYPRPYSALANIECVSSDIHSLLRVATASMNRIKPTSAMNCSKNDTQSFRLSSGDVEGPSLYLSCLYASGILGDEVARNSDRQQPLKIYRWGFRSKEPFLKSGLYKYRIVFFGALGFSRVRCAIEKELDRSSMSSRPGECHRKSCSKYCGN